MGVMGMCILKMGECKTLLKVKSGLSRPRQYLAESGMESQVTPDWSRCSGSLNLFVCFVYLIIVDML